MNVLVVDIGGTNVKILVTGQTERRRFKSGRQLTPKRMVRQVKALAKDWKYDVVAIGYPGLVVNGQPAREPRNLGRGWVKFNYRAAFGRPVKILNDAAMQALGSYRGGVMLFLGFGTGVGAALVANHTVIPMELGHLSYRKGTFEQYVGRRGIEKYGKAKWRQHVATGVERLIDSFLVDEVVLGGGNAKKLKQLPPKCRLGSNANAFVGGFRIWESEHAQRARELPRYSAPVSGTAEISQLH
jgi:polyphosphate glucokinase